MSQELATSTTSLSFNPNDYLAGYSSDQATLDLKASVQRDKPHKFVDGDTEVLFMPPLRDFASGNPFFAVSTLFFEKVLPPRPGGKPEMGDLVFQVRHDGDCEAETEVLRLIASYATRLPKQVLETLKKQSRKRTGYYVNALLASDITRCLTVAKDTGVYCPVPNTVLRLTQNTYEDLLRLIGRSGKFMFRPPTDATGSPTSENRYVVVNKSKGSNGFDKYSVSLGPENVLWPDPMAVTRQKNFSKLPEYQVTQGDVLEMKLAAFKSFLDRACGARRALPAEGSAPASFLNDDEVIG